MKSTTIQSNGQVCVVVVFYNPSQKQVSQFEKLANNIPVIAVDNSNSSRLSMDNICYFCFNENRGIAAAQNFGIRKAIEKKFNYIVFFDQDSVVDLDYIKQIVNEYKEIKEDDEKIATLGPLIINDNTKEEYKNESDENRKVSKVSTIISSGSIVECNTFIEVGFYDETLFIDLVDCEWCWRAESKGFNTYQTRNLELFHSVGKKCLKICGVYFGVSSSFRYYYYNRNLMWLWRRKYVPLVFKLKSVVRIFGDMLVVPFISDEGLMCTWHMLRGIWSGLKSNNSANI